MNIDELRQEIQNDEGRVNSVYLDHLNLPTVGIGNFNDLPEEVQKILANMMFNLGRPRLSKFRKLCKAVADRDWQECAVQMEDSRWHKQVTNRANRLISRMKSVDST